MKIVLQKSDKITYGFACFLLNFLKRVLQSNIEINRLTAINNYLNSTLCRNNKHKLRSYIIILSGIEYLKCINMSNSIIIQIDPNQKVPYYDNMTVESLCKLINYGNSELNSYPIFTNAMRFIENNIEKLYKIFSQGGMNI